jgi:hypothetical protein
MKLKSLFLLVITTLTILPTMAECITDDVSEKELKNCNILEKNGIDYAQWKADFSNPSKDESGHNMENTTQYISYTVNTKLRN